VQREVVAWASWREKRSGGRRGEVGSQICKLTKISWDEEGDGRSGFLFGLDWRRITLIVGYPYQWQGEAGKSK
jgi:hypothetical protein